MDRRPPPYPKPQHGLDAEMRRELHRHRHNLFYRSNVPLDGWIGWGFVIALVATIVGADVYALLEYGLPEPRWMIVLPVTGNIGAGCCIAWVILIGRAHRRIRRFLNGRCIKCGYDLAGNTSGVCPECGGAR